MKGLFSSESPSPSHRSALRRVRGWVIEILQLDDDAHVTVNELRCEDPDCPDVETVIAILRPGGANERYKLFRAATAITREHIEELSRYQSPTRPPFGA